VTPVASCVAAAVLPRLVQEEQPLDDASNNLPRSSVTTPAAKSSPHCQLKSTDHSPNAVNARHNKPFFYLPKLLLDVMPHLAEYVGSHTLALYR
jgi:hypothetical protein